MHQKPKKLAELQLGVRNFCADFNARNKENGAFKNVVYESSLNAARLLNALTVLPPCSVRK